MQWPLRHRYLTGFILAPALLGGSIFAMTEWVPDNTPEAQDQNRLTIEYEFSENFHYAKIEADYVDAGREAFLAGQQGEVQDPIDYDEFATAMTTRGTLRVLRQGRCDDPRASEDVRKQIRKWIDEGLPVDSRRRRSSCAAVREAIRTVGWTWVQANLYGEDPDHPREDRFESCAVQAAPETQGPGRFQRRAYLGIQERQGRGAGAPATGPRSPASTTFRLTSVSQVLGIVGSFSADARFSNARTARSKCGCGLDPADMQGIEDLKLRSSWARGPDGEQISLAQVAEFRTWQGTLPRTIRRRGSPAPSRICQRHLVTGEKKEDGRNGLEGHLGLPTTYPAGYGWSFGFWTRQRQNKEEAQFALFNHGLYRW